MEPQLGLGRREQLRIRGGGPRDRCSRLMVAVGVVVVVAAAVMAVVVVVVVTCRVALKLMDRKLRFN